MGRQSRPTGSSPVSFTHQKLLQKCTGGDFSASVRLHAPDFKSVQLLSRQRQNGPPSISCASSPAKHEREDSDTWQGGPSKMCQVTKDMATRMLHMTQFLRKKGPITVWNISPPLPQHFNRRKKNIFFLKNVVKSSDRAAWRLLKPLHYPTLVRVAPAAFVQSTINYLLLMRRDPSIQSFPCFRIYLGFLDTPLPCRKSGLSSPSLPKHIYFSFALEQGPARHLREANCFRWAGVC